MDIERMCESIEAADPAELAAGPALSDLAALVRLRNLVDHQCARLAGVLDRLRVPARQGRTIRELLIVTGCAPSVASRLARISAGLVENPRLASHSADGSLSSEHTDAIVRGLKHIQTRAGRGWTADAHDAALIDLLAQTTSGATPAEVGRRARVLGNAVADADEAGIPAADDRNINEVSVAIDAVDGRVHVRADLDAVIGEKLKTMIDGLAAPRPEPDGAPDARTVGRRHADAFERILDAAAESGDLSGAGGPRHSVLLTIPVDAPERSALAWTGAVSTDTAEMLTCDATLTSIGLDPDGAPVQISSERRLFPYRLRKALIVRDGGACIKCGAPASWAHAHHIKHWKDGGPTTIDNGCLLCPSCHVDVHHNGWDVVMGADRHPWLIPPSTVDSRRNPLPAYNRRTMRLDDAA